MGGVDGGWVDLWMSLERSKGVSKSRLKNSQRWRFQLIHRVATSVVVPGVRIFLFLSKEFYNVLILLNVLNVLNIKWTKNRIKSKKVKQSFFDLKNNKTEFFLTFSELSTIILNKF